MKGTLLLAGFSFGRHCVGIITRPYETYRKIVDQKDMSELVYIGAIALLYLAVASVVKQSLFHPFLLTRQFIVLAAGAGATFILTVGLFWRIGRLFGARGNLRGFVLGWGYTLVPTVCWFLGTSLLYLLFPPPRTTSALGIIFSVIFLLFSATLFFWKITLSYLALRFGLRLDLGKILGISSIVLPVLGLYSFGMYRLGIFRIPFL